MTIETKAADRAEARRYLNHANIEFSESLDGFEIEDDSLPAAARVLQNRLILFYVERGEL